MQLKTLYDLLLEQLKTVYPDTAAQDARFILEHRAKITWSDLITRPERDILQGIVVQINTDVDAYLAGKPLSKIYGFREFYGYKFFVNEHTLDPRPDTEVLVDAALKRYQKHPPKNILDLGTGTGCILISLLKSWSQSCGYAVDKSDAALNIAQKNAEVLGVADRIAFIQSDWAEKINQRFELIVSNPPYISQAEFETLGSNVKDHDPVSALVADQEGYEAYIQIFSDLPRILAPEGCAFFEIGYNQHEKILDLICEYGLQHVQSYKDLSGIGRVVEVSLKA